MSWIVNDSKPNEFQTAYQVLVADRLSHLQAGRGTMWDSGRVPSSNSSSVRYRGSGFAPDAVYFWKVRTWDSNGDVGPYSEPQKFTTAVGDTWMARPIWDGDEFGTGASDFLFLRTSFLLRNKEIDSAILHVTALSPEPASQYVYKLYLNGEFVGAGPERGFDDEGARGPSIAVSVDRDPPGGFAGFRYNTFDVTGSLRPGEQNVLGALNYTTHDRRFLLQMKVTYSGGEQEMIVSDRTWRAFGGDTVFVDQGNAGHDSYFHGPREGLDARNYPLGWKEPGFDDRQWHPVVEKGPMANLQASATRNTELHIVPPAEVVAKEDGRFFLDFGRTVLAGLRFAGEATEGHQMELRLGEELSAPQTVRHDMRTGNTYQEVWTLREGHQTLENFGYRAFRYAEVLNAPRGFGADSIRALVYRHPFDDTASHFESADAVLNDVWELCKYSIQATALDVYVDTHTRERRNYEGDALINQLSHYAVDREYALARYSTEYLYYRPTWPTEYKLQTIMMSWYDYLYTGNPDSLRRFYRTAKGRTLEHFINEDYLVEKSMAADGQRGRYGRDLVDWPASQRDGYQFTDINTVINSFNFAAVRALGRMAEVLGEEEEARRYGELAKKLRRAINLHLYDPATQRFRDGKGVSHYALHATAFPAALNAVEDDMLEAVGDYLADRGMAVSVYGSHFLLEALYRANRAEAALDLMRARDGNSWGHMIYNLGATVVTEAWDPPQKPNMSFSHAWASAPANAIPRGLFGIVPLEPAFERFQIKPQPGSLEWARLTTPSIKGPISVAFSQADERFEMTVQIPANSRAKVYVPAPDSTARVTKNGEPVEARFENGFLVIEQVGSGRYSLRVE
jgi:alpha-L-rhamnosidase